MNSVMTLCELNEDGTKAISEESLIYDGLLHGNHTTEGGKFYKKDGYYYLVAPAGGVEMGWQIALRSKNIYGPYEMKKVLYQGNTDINGPHQGGLVDTQTGEWWFMHFQDKGAYGRIIHLQPVTWKDYWPVMGVNDKDYCGEPVLSYKKPNVGKLIRYKHLRKVMNSILRSWAYNGRGMPILNRPGDMLPIWGITECTGNITRYFIITSGISQTC
jgi:beta-xylosidase